MNWEKYSDAIIRPVRLPKDPAQLSKLSSVDIDPNVGEQFRMRDPDGREFRVRVTDASEETVTLDGNHPLAGQDLNFEIRLVEIG